MLNLTQDTFRETEWNPRTENIDFTKKAILEILKSQKVSLSQVRLLFHCILDEIEDKNPITY